MKNEGNNRGDSGPGVGEAVQQQGRSGARAGSIGAGGDAAAAGVLAGVVGGTASSANAPVALTAGERKAFRMGVLAAGAIYIEALRAKGFASNSSALRHLENHRISIAARSVDCEPPQCWPQRGGA